MFVKSAVTSKVIREKTGKDLFESWIKETLG